jgi:streptogramin lyase
VRRLVAAVVVAVLIAGCSSSDDDGSSDNTPPATDRVEATWERPALRRDFTVENVDTSVLPVLGEPLDVAFDRRGGVWASGEFGRGVAHLVDGRLQSFTAPHGGVAPFADPFHEPHEGEDCARTVHSALAERVVVTPAGRVWSTQGGALFPPDACAPLNHSRVVGLFRGRSCAVPVPGVNGQVVGVAHDPDAGRVWFTLPSGDDGPALGWFDEDDVVCHDALDYADEDALAAATAQIHLVPLDDDIAPAHVVVDRARDAVWFTDYHGGVLGRAPLDGEGDVETFPLPAPRSDGVFRGYPWQLVATDDAVYVIEYDDRQIIRFRPGDDCDELDHGRNPCMDELDLPVRGADLHGHSLAVDGDRLWFTVAAETGGPTRPPGTAFGYVRLGTWTDTGVEGVVYDDLTGLGSTGRGPRDVRGIAVDGATGRIALADAARELVVLTPR